MKYSQPDFYHFSEDSIFLAKVAARYIQMGKVLDLCAGAGVVGIELYQLLLKQNITIDFLEIQNEYEKHLRTNLKNYQMDQIATTYFSDFSKHIIKEKYDYVVCNPPFYDEDKGRLPENNQRKICRFIQKEDFFHLIKYIEQSLRNDGIAFLLLEKDQWDKPFEHTRFKVIDEIPFDKVKSVFLLGLNI